MEPTRRRVNAPRGSFATLAGQDVEMNERTSGRISQWLATVGLAWCVAASVWIWVTPIRVSGFSTEAWSSAGAAGTISSGVRTVPFERSYRFAEVSRLGPLPLGVPVLLATWATWAAWRNKRVALSLAAMTLLAFCFVAGFSIGRGYLPAGGALLLAMLIRLGVDRQRGSGVPADNAIQRD